MNSKTSKVLPADIRLVAFDIDGVFTDGRFYLSDEGIETKAFHTQDGFGVRKLLSTGIQVAVISGRNSAAVERRMAELGVAYVIQGCADKVAAFDSVVAELGISLSQTVYAGDDVPDLPLLQHAGFSFAVANATIEVKAQCDFVTSASGGFGAVREICELVLVASGDA